MNPSYYFYIKFIIKQIDDLKQENKIKKSFIQCWIYQNLSSAVNSHNRNNNNNDSSFSYSKDAVYPYMNNNNKVQWFNN